jgi:hypothetical protein
MPVPKEVDWDLWLGTAPYRDYHEAYLPFRWRGWWDYGTGALGDMGCHIMDVPFRALKLGYPVSVECSVGSVYSDFFKQAHYADSCPPSSVVYLKFPARGNMPEVDFSWSDGGKMQNVTLPPAAIPLVEGGPEGHQQQWVKACKKGYGAYTSSPFEIAGPLTETVIMGNLAVRSYDYRQPKADGKGFTFPGRKKLLWDGQQMKITNFDEANQFVKREYRAGW